ncbi:TPA: phage tail tape measure protein [Photobacterium damselae]
MSEKISFVLDATVNGLQDIVSTTSATERLTQALESQRGEVKSLNSQLRNIKGFESAELKAEKLAAQLVETKKTMSRLDDEIIQSKKSTTQLRGEYSLTQNEIRGLNAQMATASDERLVSLKNQLKAAELRLESLNVDIHQSKAHTNSLSVAYKRASGKVETLTGRQVKQSATLNKLKQSLHNAGISTDHLGEEQRRLKLQTDKATASLEKQNAHLKEMQSIQGRIDSRKAKLGELGSQATGLAAAAAPIAGSIWTAVKNESSFADVKKVVDMNDEQAKELQSWALKTSTTTPMSANDVNAMLAAGGQSGIADINELKEFVLDSSKMGVAFDMEAGQAGETLSVFKAALGVDQKGAMNVAGLANYLSNNSNAKAKDIAGVMAREGASAKTGGFSINESTALSASLLSLGMGEERAATALKNISGRLTLGDAASGNQKKAMAAIGLDASDIAENMQKDASGTLIHVLEALNQAPEEDKSALLSQIFGEEAKGAVASLSGNMENFSKLLKLSKENSSIHLNSLDKEYQSRISTTESGIDMFVNKLNRLSVVFGTALLPALNWVLEPLGKGVDLLADFAQENEGVTQAVGLGVAAFIGLKGALLAGKALSLVFGNSMDKTRLFTKGLNRETQDGGRIAALAARRWRSLNEAVAASRGPTSSGGGLGQESRRRTKRSRIRRSSRKRGLGRVIDTVANSRIAQNLSSGVQSLLGSGKNPIQAMVAPLPAAVPMVRSSSSGLGNIVNGVTESRIGKGVSAGSKSLLGHVRHNPMGSLLAVAGSGLALDPMADMASDVIGIGTDIAEKAGKTGLTKVLKPLGMAMSATSVIDGVAHGDMEKAGGALGDLGGSMGGGALGATIGTMIFPGVGTAIGGLLGSIAGGMGGEMLGSWFGRKLDSPEETAKKVEAVQSQEASAKQSPPVTYSPSFQIHAAPGQDPKVIAQEVSKQINHQLAALMGENTVSTQFSYAAIDRDS